MKSTYCVTYCACASISSSCFMLHFSNDRMHVFCSGLCVCFLAKEIHSLPLMVDKTHTKNFYSEKKLLLWIWIKKCAKFNQSCNTWRKPQTIVFSKRSAELYSTEQCTDVPHPLAILHSLPQIQAVPWFQISACDPFCLSFRGCAVCFFALCDESSSSGLHLDKITIKSLLVKQIRVLFLPRGESLAIKRGETLAINLF